MGENAWGKDIRGEMDGDVLNKLLACSLSEKEAGGRAEDIEKGKPREGQFGEWLKVKETYHGGRSYFASSSEAKSAPPQQHSNHDSIVSASVTPVQFSNQQPEAAMESEEKDQGAELEPQNSQALLIVPTAVESCSNLMEMVVEAMPTTDLHDGSSSSTFGFSILSRRRDQVHHAVDPTHESNNAQEMELEDFQKKVAARFHDLASASPDDFLSIPWLQKLLDAFLSSQEEFNLIISHNRAQLSKPPMDRHLSEFFERSVKALDVCNAIRDGIEQIRQWQKQLEIVLCALDSNNTNNNISHKSLGEGQFRRAKKALVDLALCMLDEKESNTAALAHRNRSFGRNNAQKEQKGLAQFRSLSWSVSRSWSAARQLQAISSNLAAPRANEIVSTNGLSLAVFTMSYVLLIVTWALVAAIPCQDRGLQTHFYVSRQFLWAGPILSIHERVLEESKKRERRNSCGLLKEIHEIEKCGRQLNEFVDSVKVFPLGEEREMEVRERVSEAGAVYGALRDGLDPMEKRVRDVFHRIVRGRMEGLDSVGRASNSNGNHD
ncbi:Protein of unknown function (DUF793 [Striga hermonthica]|uniref:Uncharacterized protein n=1 Tax=Striga hermonthica TaxID=68872 RepID=A0A9N7R5B8_STRHE|nr:Protein of unknown function (DUF793 [Striga hermonthica]